MSFDGSINLLRGGTEDSKIFPASRLLAVAFPFPGNRSVKARGGSAGGLLPDSNFSASAAGKLSVYALNRTDRRQQRALRGEVTNGEERSFSPPGLEFAAFLTFEANDSEVAERRRARVKPRNQGAKNGRPRKFSPVLPSQQHNNLN